MIIILGGLLGSILVGVLFGREEKVRKFLILGTTLVFITMIFYVILMIPRITLFQGWGTNIYFMLLAGTLFLLSLASTFIIVPIQAHIQKETPTQYMSRVFSIIGLLSRGGIPIGTLIYGLALEHITLHSTMTFSTILTILASTVVLVSILKVQKI
ncbi:hypothetical protein R0131_13515 [Clostridium sp. AL.422]|nr:MULTISPECIES: hypothetical protein [unclassified Clostridium]MDV4151841.1 hypothetical protein [Clostridium sp. AL.422]